LRNCGADERLTTITDQDGLYCFSLLPPGEYELTVEAAGFSPLVVREVMIQITEVRSIGTKLAVKGAREEVVVKAPLLQTDNAALGRVIDVRKNQRNERRFSHHAIRVEVGVLTV
jgi:hypothetical protein